MSMMSNAVNKNNALTGWNGMVAGGPNAAGCRIPAYWAYNPGKNNYIPITKEPFSAFPTIVDVKKKAVWCRACHRWEYITAFSDNKLKTSCGKLYDGPLVGRRSDFFYGYVIHENKGVWDLCAKGQVVSTDYRRLFDMHYQIDTDKKRIRLGDRELCDADDLYDVPCPELTQAIMARLGDSYERQYGIKPSVSSGLRGMSLVLGYMLCPFNINFYVISRHWGLQPYDENFTSLSSGDTPSAENEMFASMGIRPTKSVRKLYQMHPYGIIGYAAAHDLGFTDVNLLQKSTGHSWYEFFNHYLISFGSGTITYDVRAPLRMFVQDMLAVANQKTVWNSIERTVKSFNAGNDEARRNITDALNMYQGMAELLTEREKREILREGFNLYIHDFLLRRYEALTPNQRRNSALAGENVVFYLEPQFLALEYKSGDAFRTNPKTKEREPVPDEERWCFYVARDSHTLKRIGSEMDNCVGWGYATAVKERKATIVYAMHKNKYKICIEVTPDFSVRQAFGPRNSILGGEAFDAYSEWCKEKHIVREKVFRVAMAPQ